MASAQSTYSSQCAVGVAARRCALISGRRCEDISIPRAAAIPAACIQPVTPPIRAASGITRSQASAASASSIASGPLKFSPICTGTASARAIDAAPR
jgi:hypothetical protein